MVLPFIIGGGLALLTGFTLIKVSKKVNNVQHNVRDFVKTSRDVADEVRHDTFGIIRQFEFTTDAIVSNLNNNINKFTNICCVSFVRLSHRIDVSINLLTNVVSGFLTACSLSLLFYLTDSSLLRTIVWFFFVSLCFYMTRNYITQSKLLKPLQSYDLSNHLAIETTASIATTEPLIKQRLTPKRLPYKPCAVVIGRTGAGKTTLTNGLCGTEHAAGEGRGSVTRNLFRNDVTCGNNTFSLIDTPGTDSTTETYKHAILLREALTATKINTIFVVIKYESRFDKMIEKYFEVEQPVYNYRDKIVVIISHWDQVKNPENSFKEICDLFQDECPQVTNLIFCSDQSSKTQIANLMYSCISNMNKETLSINDTDFFLKFNIYQMNNQMKLSFEQYQKEVSSLVQEHTELINSVKSEPAEDKDEVLHMTIVRFKNEMEILLQKFQQQYGSAMQELDYYVFCITMEQESVKICDEFVGKVVPFMSYNMFDNQDPRNLIKRCPHCHLIWFKTEGYDGITTCGNNSFEDRKEFTNKACWKYQLERTAEKLTWKKNPVASNFDTESENDEANWEDFDEEQDESDWEDSDAEQDEDRMASFMRQSIHKQRTFFDEAFNVRREKQVGCGKQFIWSDLPKIEDELILELFKVKTIDQAKQFIQNGSFVEARHNYEANVDMTFHT